MRNNKHHFRHNFAKCFFFNRRVKVGILGGSFDPPHYGHIHLSSIALKKLQLDEIWWLVSPQNRLKKKDIIQSFFSRLNYARKLTVNNKKIKVLDLEYVNKLFSSYNSIKFLKTKCRDTKFIWLMGSDNLLNFNKWLKAKQISKTFPVAVIERPSYSYKAINCLGAKQLGKRIKKVKLSNFNHKFSAWIFIRDKLSNISSTKIRDINTKH